MRKLVAMRTLGQILADGLAKHAATQVKTASVKIAARRWLQDSDLVKLCETCKKYARKKA